MTSSLRVHYFTESLIESKKVFPEEVDVVMRTNKWKQITESENITHLVYQSFQRDQSWQRKRLTELQEQFPNALITVYNPEGTQRWYQDTALATYHKGETPKIEHLERML